MNFSILKVFCVLCSLGILGACTESAKKKNPLKTLSEESENFELPSPQNVILFPSAHYTQKSYKQEWWYLTANLVTDDGIRLASQWTLFRRAVDDKHWYFAHAALADNNAHLSDYRNGREETGSVKVQTTPFRAQLDDWIWIANSSIESNVTYDTIDRAKDKAINRTTNGAQQELLPARLEYGNKPKSRVSQEKHKDDWAVCLQLHTSEPYFLQGENGFSLKHPVENIASHYYSQPFIDVSGKVFWQGRWRRVSGQAWFDREWGSKMLAEDQQGWDWFSLRLNHNKALMVYQIRSDKQTHIYASIMERGGLIKTYDTSAVKVRDLSGKHLSTAGYPTRFHIQIEEAAVDIVVDVVNEGQLMRYGIEYFEGMVVFEGSHQGQGFLEMTGYR